MTPRSVLAPHPALTPHPARIGIGLPVYNGEAYLEASLRSLLAQTCGEFQILVSDNASTDRTEEIARAFVATDSRIRYHRQPANIGLGGNFNFVARSLDSPYFKWATADDLCEPTFLERCTAILDAEPDVVLAYPRTQFIDEAGAELREVDAGFDLRSESISERLQYVLLADEWVNCTLGVIRKPALDRTHLLPAYAGGDFALLAELAVLGRFFEVPERLFRRRLHEAGSGPVYEDPERRMTYVGTARTSVRIPHWLRIRDDLRTIRRAPIAIHQKLALFWALVRKTNWQRARLASELSDALRARLGLAEAGPRP